MPRNIAGYLKYTILTLILGCMATGCSDNVEPEIPQDPHESERGYITIDVVAAKSPSRGINDEPGIDLLNENAINNVVLCLWPKDATRPETVPPVFMENYINLEATGVATLRVPLTPALRYQLFETEGSNNPCLAYVAVNVDPGQATTVAELKQLVVDSEFATYKDQQQFTMDGDAQLSVSPDLTYATGIINAHRSACKITVSVNCESELVETDKDGNTLTWVPNLDAMRVKLYSGVHTSTLSPKPVAGEIPEDYYFDTPSSLQYNFTDSLADERYPLVQATPFYTYPNAWTLQPDEEHRTFVALSLPWSSDGGASWRTCYYQVPVVPVTSESLVRNTSYHIKLHLGMLGSFVPEEPIELPDLSYTAADWSTESLNVEIPDYRFLVVEQENYTFNNVETMEIPFYTSHDTEVIDATMTFYRFNYSDEGSKFSVTVDLNSPSNTLYNQAITSKVYNARFINEKEAQTEGKTQPFLRIWHPLKMYQPMKGNAEISLTNNDGPNSTRDKTQDNAKIATLLAEATSYLQQPDAEFSRVDYVITVQHSDMKGTPLWTETVKVSQYPAIYIDATPNNYTRYLKSGKYELTGTGAMASCWVNGNCESIGDYGGGVTPTANYWYTSIGLESDGNFNWNPNLYVITVTTLPANSTFQIGDPRRRLINNNLEYRSMLPENENQEYLNYAYPNDPNYSFKEGNALEGGRRSLSYYYPTQPGSATQNMIAPKIRICSSYAGTGPGLNFVRARFRAAAFQEMGYPAGRWRLPTYAEVEFIMSLSAEFKIPRLFGRSGNNTWYYWCAQGEAVVPGKAASNQTPSLRTDRNNTNNNYQRARFVYDEWYWGSQMIDKDPPAGQQYPEYPFTWGDAERISM